MAIEIGGLPVCLRTDSPAFLRLLEERYAGFVNPSARPEFEFEVDLVPRGKISEEDDVRVRFDSGTWSFERGDFRAEWLPALRRGRIRQWANPYSIDAVLRIVHTLLLARQGGFLLHAASAVRNGRAFLFSGRSGAGKTTLSRLAPPDVTLLTDEISYVRPQSEGAASGYRAFGTPFAGELARVGENLSAPVAALYFLAQGPENRLEPVPAAEAARTLLENILFFAEDPELVKLVFQSACEFVSKVPLHRLVFLPDSRVWEMIR
ncbi:MAG: hypothetical protein HY236_17115 [Acidobacteria bacterium]|nr:hypothetical protein [Acidobacteriota bacterium]